MHTPAEAANITSLVFEHFAGIDKNILITQPDLQISEEVVDRLYQSLAELKTGKPVQYITGEGWFYKMKLKVTPAVLIPRPETEELVEQALSWLKTRNANNVIDIGTGSGCIAIALKKHLPAIHITAIEVDADALAIAEDNAASQQTAIQFVQLDFLKKNNWEVLEGYDLIISNPPYIANGEAHLMEKNVTEFEPHLALFVPDDDPLLYYRAIAAFAATHLNKHGCVLAEINELYGKEVSGIFTNAGYECNVIQDMSGKERMLKATHSL